ncbi:hypothetical protein [Prevotella koreensis]|uniref:hypothetical protein n=1 Tax=Prevotella koreensis TaxID=2490854 RepID=UPI0028EB5713|nr:hypothetical protein [Prevotella koreensis]
MKRYIHIKKEDREFIAKVFGITERMVFKAIGYESNTELAKKVRKLAKERGGIIMREVPELETLFDSDGYIRQYLPGGVLLEIYKAENWCDVYKKGEKKRRFENVMMSDLSSIQKYATTLK